MGNVRKRWKEEKNAQKRNNQTQSFASRLCRIQSHTRHRASFTHSTNSKHTH